MNECCNISMSGIDTTHPDDPFKVWQCDACRTLYKENFDTTEFYHVKGRLCYCGADWEPKEIQRDQLGVLYECPHCARAFTLRSIEKMFGGAPE